MGCSGLIAAGVFSGLEGTMGLAGWQWLFIIEASTGVFFALIGPFFIPDFPASNKGAATIWFTPEQRDFAKQRLALDRVSEPRAKESVWNGLKLVVTDPKAWIFVSQMVTSLYEANHLTRDSVLARCQYFLRLRLQQLLPVHRPRYGPRIPDQDRRPYCASVLHDGLHCHAGRLVF